MKQLFELDWRVDPDAETVIPPDGREGVHLSDGVGQATGDLAGPLRFSMYTADCPLDPGYLGQPAESRAGLGDHVCSVNPGAILETDDGATVQLDMKGFGLRLEARAPIWTINGSLRLHTTDHRYRWLNNVLCVFEGTFDEDHGTARYRVHAQTD